MNQYFKDEKMTFHSLMILTSETVKFLPNAMCAAKVATGAIEARSRAIDMLIACMKSSLTRSTFSLDLISGTGQKMYQFSLAKRS